MKFFLLTGLFAVAFAAPQVENEVAIEKAQMPWFSGMNPWQWMPNMYQQGNNGFSQQEYPIDYSLSCNNNCNCNQVCVIWMPCGCRCPPPCPEVTTTTTTKAPTTTTTTSYTTTPPTVKPEPETTPPCNGGSCCRPCMPCNPCMIWWMCQPCNCNNGCSTEAPTTTTYTTTTPTTTTKISTLPPTVNPETTPPTSCCQCPVCIPWFPCQPCGCTNPCNQSNGFNSNGFSYQNIN